MRRPLVILTLVLAASGVARATPGPPHVEGPDIPAAGAPVAGYGDVMTDVRFECTERAVTRTIDVPPAPWDRVIAEVTITPDGDPWDRLFGLAIGGVEVMRGTTPRTAMTVRRDVTEYASLLPAGGTADVTLYLGSYVGALLGSVRLDFYRDEPTAALVRGPVAAAVPVLTWNGELYRDGSRVEREARFPDLPASSAMVELTLSGHGEEEFWFQGHKRPRIFHVAVDGIEVATVSAMPYVYALLGLGNENANTACVGPGTSPEGDLLHPLMWWTAQRALNTAGVHTGDGEIPPYRAIVDPALLPLLTGGRTVTITQENGTASPRSGARWVSSLSFLLD